MPSSAPRYVKADPPIPVRATVRGQVVDAAVVGWAGDRVDITWKSPMGNHVGWVPAADVERTVQEG